MYTLGLDPGASNFGWSLLLDAYPLAGGTIQRRSNRRTASAIKNEVTDVIGGLPDLIAIEVGWRGPVAGYFKDWAGRNGIEVKVVRPISKSQWRKAIRMADGGIWHVTSNHEKDAFFIGLKGYQIVQKRGQ